MRLVSVEPWADARNIEIATVRRDALFKRLTDEVLTSYLTKLSASRGAIIPITPWTSGPHTNASDSLSCSCTVSTPDGRTALSVEVTMHLPTSLDPNVVSCVQVSVHDLDAWRALLAENGAQPVEDLRLSMAEVAEFYAAASHSAAILLPTVLGDDLPVRYFSPPRTQIVLATDREDHTKPYPPLERYVKVESLGPNDRQQLSRIEVAISASPPADLGVAARLTREALVFAVGRFGFYKASPAIFC
jgi:hypothetical protein